METSILSFRSGSLGTLPQSDSWQCCNELTLHACASHQHSVDVDGDSDDAAPVRRTVRVGKAECSVATFIGAAYGSVFQLAEDGKSLHRSARCVGVPHQSMLCSSDEC